MEKLVIKNFNFEPKENIIYSLRSEKKDNLYEKRTNRNIGWITESEQSILRNSTVGIAGCGGMGGLLAITLLRLGVGKIKIADNDVFDITNLNRQYSATLKTIGKSKAFMTAKDMVNIANDVDIDIYPMGINRESVFDFIKECDIICDEIEFWCLGSRTLLHQFSRKNSIPILNCNTVGHQTNLFYFDPYLSKIEDVSGLSLEEAFSVQEKVQNNLLSRVELRDILKKITRTLVPEQPNYGIINSEVSIKDKVIERLENESIASIIATNPPMASGFMANHVLFQLLRKSEVKRNTILPPPFPGYVSLDVATMKFTRIEK